MDIPMQMERALMSASVNPMAVLAARTTVLMAAVISYPLICCHVLPLLMLEIGVSPVAPLR